MTRQHDSRMPDRRAADVAFAAGAVLGAGLVLALFAGHYGATVHANDFGIIWSGPRALLDGLDPYDPASWTVVRARYGMTPAPIPIYTYPPWVAVGLLPIALVPVEVAAWAWATLGVGAALVALRALLRALVPDLAPVHGLAAFTLFASQPGVATFFSGQFGFLQVAAVSATVVLLRSGRPVLAGLATCVLALKPHAFVFAVWAFVRMAVARGEHAYAAVLVCALAAVALVVVTTWPAFAVWLGVVPGMTITSGTATTLPAILNDLSGDVGAFAAAALMFGLVASALAFDPRGDAWPAVWTSVSLAATTYSRSYDQVVLVVPLTIAVGALRARSPRAAMALAIAGFGTFALGSIVLQVLAAAREREDTAALLPIGTAVLLVAALWRERGSRPMPARDR